MANDQTQTINAGIANAKRFKDFLRMVSMVDPDSRNAIENGTDATFIKILTTHKNKKLRFSVSAATQLLAVRRDYFKYRYSPILTEQEEEESNPNDNRAATNAINEIVALASIPGGS